MRRVALLASSFFCALAAGSCGGGAPPADCSCGPCKATVSRVVDGDTIELSSGEKVRYLMVDAPETTSGKMDCYGAQAVTFNQQMVEGREVELKYDPGQCRDRYGRLLAYVTVDGREVNSLIIERGYGCVLYLPPAGMSREVEFKTLEAQAKSGNSGVWGACNPVTCDQ